MSKKSVIYIYIFFFKEKENMYLIMLTVLEIKVAKFYNFIKRFLKACTLIWKDISNIRKKKKIKTYFL